MYGGVVPGEAVGIVEQVTTRSTSSPSTAIFLAGAEASSPTADTSMAVRAR